LRVKSRKPISKPSPMILKPLRVLW